MVPLLLLTWPLSLLSLSDHLQKELLKHQRRHRRRAQPQRAAVHGDRAESRAGVRVPPYRADPEGLGRGRRGLGGHDGKERYP